MSMRYERIVQAIKHFHFSDWEMQEVDDLIAEGYDEWIHSLAAKIEEYIYQ